MTSQLQLFSEFSQKTDEDNNSTNPSALCLLTKRSMETVINCVCAFVLVYVYVVYAKINMIIFCVSTFLFVK